MKRCLGLAAIVLAVVLTAGASSAQAAKGAKKNGEHKVHGKVIAMHQGKKGATMTVKVHHHHKKKAQQAAAAAAPPAPAGVKHHHSHKTFHLTNATQVEVVRGKQHQPAGAAAIHKGAHVTVMAKGHHADKVAVHHHKKSAAANPSTTTPPASSRAKKTGTPKPKRG